MTKKRGVTVSMLIIVVVVLAILTTAIVTSTSNSIDNSKLSIWVQEMSFIQDIINEKKTIVSADLLSEITFDVSSISNAILTEQFKGEKIIDNKVTLYEIDLLNLDFNNTVYGMRKTANDIYAYSKATGKVYYLEGFSISNSQIYYTLTEELKNKYNNQNETSGNLSTVVFKASSVTYTNKPVTVTVNVPKTYTDIEVTTSNESVVVGEQVEEDSKYTYAINTTSYAGNYETYVEYNDGTEVKSITYAVTIYDDVEPVIDSYTRDGDKITFATSDALSGIKEIKYITTSMPTENVQEYFRQNGIKVRGTTFTVDSALVPVVLYVEDNAGNFTTVTEEVTTLGDLVASAEDY